MVPGSNKKIWVKPELKKLELSDEKVASLFGIPASRSTSGRRAA